MRESLFERLKKRKISYLNEIKRVYELIIDRGSTAGMYFKMALKTSPFCTSFNDFDSAMIKIFETTNYFGETEGSFDEILGCASFGGFELTINSFLDYLEFFRTLLDFSSNYYDANVGIIKQIVEEDCVKIGYELVLDEDSETYKTMLKNPQAEVVVLQVPEIVGNKITRYLTIRKGNIEAKRECVKSLADDVEEMCKTYSNISEYNKLKQFIQCVRHTKDKPNKNFPFYYEDEEKWLDKIFDMIIGVLSFTKTKEIVKEIIDLEDKNKNNR